MSSRNTQNKLPPAPTLAFRLKNFALGGLAGMCATCCVSAPIVCINFIF